MIVIPQNMRQYLPSYNFKLEPTRLHDFLLRAQDWLTENIIGPDIESDLENPVQEGQDDPHSRLRTMACRVICETAYLTAVAEMDLQLSEAGFVVQNNEKMSPASQQRVERLIGSLQERQCNDCDSLVKYLMDYSVEHSTLESHDKYADWRGSAQFEMLTQAFMPTLSELRRSCRTVTVARWPEFLELQTAMSRALHSTVANYVSEDQVNALLDLYRDNELVTTHQRALKLIRMAVGAETEGLHDNAVHFAIEASNLMLSNEADFQEFVNSDRYVMPKPFDFGEGSVANLL